MIFGIEAPSMTNKASEIIANVADWFTSPQGTFIRVFRAFRNPHLMSLFVTDKVVMK